MGDATKPNRLIINPRFDIGEWVRPVTQTDGCKSDETGQVVAHEVYTDHAGTREVFEVRFREHGLPEREPRRLRADELEPA